MSFQIVLQTLTQRTRPFSMNQQNLGESRKYGIIDNFSKHIFGLKDGHAAHIDLWSYFCRFPGNRSSNMNFRALLMFFSSHESTGIHLDNPDTPVPAGYKGRVSRTCTDLSRLKETRKKSEYVFLKNVFGSFDSGDGEPTFTFPQLEEAAKDGLFDRHVYALGGINLENVRTAKELGFGGVVIRDDLWNKFDIQSQTDFKEVIQHFEKLRKAAN